MGISNGMYPRNFRTLGIKAIDGAVKFLSQLWMDASSTPNFWATSLWKSFRSRRFFFRWSPNVFNDLGYAGCSGLLAFKTTLQNGNAGMFLQYCGDLKLILRFLALPLFTPLRDPSHFNHRGSEGYAKAYIKHTWEAGRSPQRRVLPVILIFKSHPTIQHFK